MSPDGDNSYMGFQHMLRVLLVYALMISMSFCVTISTAIAQTQFGKTEEQLAQDVDLCVASDRYKLWDAYEPTMELSTRTIKWLCVTRFPMTDDPELFANFEKILKLGTRYQQYIHDLENYVPAMPSDLDFVSDGDPVFTLENITGHTLLVSSVCGRADPAFIAELIRKGSDANHIDYGGWSVFDWAMRCNHHARRELRDVQNTLAILDASNGETKRRSMQESLELCQRNLVKFPDNVSCLAFIEIFNKFEPGVE